MEVDCDRLNVNHPIEILRDGHIIYTYGYSGSGPMLECIEQLDGNLVGTTVRTECISDTIANLLVYAKVSIVEANKISFMALQTLSKANVQVKVNEVVTGRIGSTSGWFDGIDDPEEVYRSLKSAPALWKKAWAV